MLKLENINVTMGKGSNLERQILRNINIDIAKGEFLVIIGGNGAGKSTMFNVISGYILPDNGNIYLDTQDITKKAQSERARFFAKVMQDPKIGTMENMTIEENMSFAYRRGQSYGLSRYKNYNRRKLFQEKLAMLGMGLEDRLSELVGNLSGGQRQALSLIMAVISESKVLLLDEITAALDPQAAANVMRIAASVIAEEKLTSIMITHNMADALYYGDRVLLLSDGKIMKEFSKLTKSRMTSQQLAAEFNEL